MGIYIGNKLEEEVRRIVKSQRHDGSTIQPSDVTVLLKQLKELTETVEALKSRIEKLEKGSDVQAKPQQAHPKQVQGHSAPVGQTQVSVKNEPKKPSRTYNTTKIVYSGFEGNGFPIKLKVGIDTDGLNNARGNWVVEAVKGEPTGTFYPNPALMQSLAFNADFNMAPVCDITHTGKMGVVSPGSVRLDGTSNTFVITKKCSISV